jgi:ribosomal protein S30
MKLLTKAILKQLPKLYANEKVEVRPRLRRGGEAAQTEDPLTRG